MFILKHIRKLILVVLAIGLPTFIYLGFIAKEPIFEPEYDVEIGNQTVASIALDTLKYPILSKKDYPEAYAYLKRMVNEITGAPDIKYAKLFKYDSIQVIQRDDVLNAFCTPGGYVYVYTGLIKYLDRADDLAGVLGHEIAHAELRHSAVRIQKEFGREKIMDYLLVKGVGLSALIKAEILKRMLTLNYTRGQEADSDRHSVLYLKDTDYACNGAAGFFKKLIANGKDTETVELLSDHPDSQSRVDDIKLMVNEYKCSTNSQSQSGWITFKNMLPESIKDIEISTKVGTEEENKEES